VGLSKQGIESWPSALNRGINRMSKKNLAFATLFLIKIFFLLLTNGQVNAIDLLINLGHCKHKTLHMPVTVIRKEQIFQPDSSRVITRFLFAGDERAKRLIKAVLAFTDKQQREVLSRVQRKYATRHRSIQRIFANHFKRVAPFMEQMEIDHAKLPEHVKLLIGAYFTMEYSIEAAAFFNPSIVLHPDQHQLGRGQKR